MTVLDRETARWEPHFRVDVFEEASVEAARVFHGLDREPTGPELLAWARATKDLPAGDLVTMQHPGGRARLVESVAPRPGDPPFGDFCREEAGNLLTRLGLARLGNLFIGATGLASQALNATHCRVGVGNGLTVAATTDTDLAAAAGSGNRQFKLVDSVAQGTGANSGVTTAIATLAAAQGNFVWNEWGIDGGTADGTTVTAETASTPGLCNRKLFAASPLTKASPTVAVITVTITIA